MTKPDKNIRARESAFTIVELLIVVVVIAILATITILSYNAFQNRAVDTGVEADIATIIKKIEVAKADLGRYPQTTAEFPDGFRFNKSVYDPTQNNIYYCVDKANDLYAFGLRSKTLKGYVINTGSVSKGVSVYGQGTCDAIGKTWGNDATTAVIQGYVGASTTWSSTWNWTK